MTQASIEHISFRGRSFPVLALEPDAPLDNWIHHLDACLARSPAFFAKKSIVVDVSGLGLDRPGVVGLVDSLTERGIRIMGLTGVEPSWAADDFPPILIGGRGARASAEPKGDAASSKGLTADERANFDEISRTLGAGNAEPPVDAADAEPQPEPVRPVPLIVNSSVRSGQSIYHPEGDVTVIGSVSSGADIVAGGSIHIYGTIRGRAIAGSQGDRSARIFCRRLEAELLAIGGVYMTNDAMASNLRSQAIHAWLDNDSMMMAKLD